MKMIDISEFLSKIKLLNYILIKVDTPYMPHDFPYSYPIGKDMDIIVTKEDFPQLVKVANDFSTDYSANFGIKVIEKIGNCRLRFEKRKALHYQIDISCEFMNLPLWFIEESIDHRVMKKNIYYITEVKYEIVYRMISLQSSPKKKHHGKYVEDNRRYIDRELMDRMGLTFRL